MSSRQNRETRPEYPTGHNKGNESPDRSVPRTNGGNDKPVATFGAPMGVPPVVDDTEEREALLATTPTDEEVAAHVSATESESKEETRRRAEDEAANRATEAPEVNPTADISIWGAEDDIREHQQDVDETDR
jgi:hypothetical protein